MISNVLLVAARNRCRTLGLKLYSVRFSTLGCDTRLERAPVFKARHDPLDSSYVFSNHIHPTLELRSRRRSTWELARWRKWYFVGRDSPSTYLHSQQALEFSSKTSFQRSTF